MAKGKLVRVRVLYIVVAAAVGGSFYISIIYYLTVAGKYPFLSLQHDRHRCHYFYKEPTKREMLPRSCSICQGMNNTNYRLH